MADIIDLSEALVERVMPVLETFVDDWKVEWSKPDPVVYTPLLCVTADKTKFVDYLQVPPLWSLRLSFYLSAIHQTQSRRMLASVFDQNGPLIAALQSEDIDDRLWSLAPYTVVATMGRGWDLVKEKRNTYLCADMGVQLGAN